MEYLNVVAAAAVSYVFGAIWYMALAKPWMTDSGVPVGPDGRPANAAHAMTYIVAFLSVLVVAGMMRHMFALSGIETPGKGMISGLGIGLFLACPWIVTNYSFADRPARLALIDGGYAAIGSMLIGLVLNLF